MKKSVYEKAIEYSNQFPDFLVWERIFKDSEWGPYSAYSRIMLVELETGVSWHNVQRAAGNGPND